MMEAIGWLGAMMLALCGAPAAYKVYKDKSAEGLSGAFIGLWLGGEILTLTYVLPIGSIPLIANYALNIVLVGVMAYYKWRHLIVLPKPSVFYPTLEMEEWFYDSLEKADWYWSLTKENGLRRATLVFAAEHFAPGAWAGMEGWKFAQGRHKYMIVKVDLENRCLHVKEYQ
jgi:hypothetical protein